MRFTILSRLAKKCNLLTFPHPVSPVTRTTLPLDFALAISERNSSFALAAGNDFRARSSIVESFGVASAGGVLLG